MKAPLRIILESKTRNNAFWHVFFFVYIATVEGDRNGITEEELKAKRDENNQLYSDAWEENVKKYCDYFWKKHAPHYGAISVYFLKKNNQTGAVPIFKVVDGRYFINDATWEGWEGDEVWKKSQELSWLVCFQLAGETAGDILAGVPLNVDITPEKRAEIRKSLVDTFGQGSDEFAAAMRAMGFNLAGEVSNGAAASDPSLSTAAQSRSTAGFSGEECGTRGKNKTGDNFDVGAVVHFTKVPSPLLGRKRAPSEASTLPEEEVKKPCNRDLREAHAANVEKGLQDLRQAQDALDKHRLHTRALELEVEKKTKELKQILQDAADNL